MSFTIRAPLCDRFVITLINKKIITPDDLTKREDGAVMLNEQGRRTFITAWQKRKDDELKHPFLEEKMEWGIVAYAQALLLSRYIRGNLDAYPPFMWK